MPNLPKARTFIGPAQIWKRIVAFLIDLFIINLFVLFPFKKLLQKFIPQESYIEAYNYLINNPELSRVITAISLLMGIITLLYFVILELKLQQTIGKIILNIKVISIKKQLKLWQAIVRSLFILPIFPFVLLWIIDPLYLIFAKKGQRLSEVLSFTKTIEVYAM